MTGPGVAALSEAGALNHQSIAIAHFTRAHGTGHHWSSPIIDFIAFTHTKAEKALIDSRIQPAARKLYRK